MNELSKFLFGLVVMCILVFTLTTLGTITTQQKPAIVIPDYKDEIAELAFSLQEIKAHINKEHDLKAEMRMECSERLSNMVLQAERLRRTVPNYKLGD